MKGSERQGKAVKGSGGARKGTSRSKDPWKVSCIRSRSYCRRNSGVAAGATLELKRPPICY